MLGRGQPSGYGFEITFRLKRDKKDTTPPTWPAELMQSLAKYVFQSGIEQWTPCLITVNYCLTIDNLLCPGDHVSWHKPLDSSESRIRHMLLTEDPQLSSVDTSLGTCSFVQVNHPITVLHSVCMSIYTMVQYVTWVYLDLSLSLLGAMSSLYYCQIYFFTMLLHSNTTL